MTDPFVIGAALLFAASAGYMGFAIERVFAMRRRLRRRPVPMTRPPVTLLKPLCGTETEFIENLRTFCSQDYPDYQIVFGVRDPADPAIVVVDALRAEFPERDMALVIDERIHGANLKVSNLINMMAAAKHDILIVSDSDMRVEPHYIDALLVPFDDANVGAASCLYSGSARGGVASKLGAMFINDWFFPSTLIPLASGDPDFCLGATMAVRRRVLEDIGGFQALADYLADDYMLGHLTAAKGHRVAVAPYIIENIVDEPDLKSLFAHELRWARTIRSVRPMGYFGSAVTELLPISAAVSAVFWGAGLPVAVWAGPLALAAILRYALHRVSAATLPSGGTYAPWLIPVRDIFTLTVRFCSFFGRSVTWRAQVMVIEPNTMSRSAPGNESVRR